MEGIIASIIEKSLIGFAFIYMLHYFLTNVSTTMKEVSKTLSTITSTLAEISVTMKDMDARISKLEERG